jgi:hypothetical protein
MSRSVVLLATLHDFQGLPGYPGSVEDPTYASGIESCILSGRVDFVFEEASGLGPSTAEQRSNSLLGADHYLDIDSGRDKPNPFIGPKPICGFASLDPEKMRNRETQWLKRLIDHGFKKGLVICGVAHSLSFAFQLQEAGLGVQLCYHLPYDILCKRPHAE